MHVQFHGVGLKMALYVMIELDHIHKTFLIPWKDRRAHADNIGVVFGRRSQLWWDVPVIDAFELILDIYRVHPALPLYRLIIAACADQICTERRFL